FTHSKKPAVNFRVQRLYPPIQEFGKAGEIRDIAHSKCRAGEGRLCSARGNKLDSIARKSAREFDKTGFVRNGNQGPCGAAEILGHDRTLLCRGTGQIRGEISWHYCSARKSVSLAGQPRELRWASS